MEQPQQHQQLQSNQTESGHSSKDIIRESAIPSAEVIVRNDEEISENFVIKTISRDGRTLRTSDVQNDDTNNPVSTPTSTQLKQL